MHDLALQYVETSAEPCVGFVAVESGAPVCAACGWLDHEHTVVSVPEPRRARVRRAGRRRPLAAAS